MQCDVTFRALRVDISNSEFDYLAFWSDEMRMANCDGNRLFLKNNNLSSGRYDGFTARNCNFNGDLEDNSTCFFSPTSTTREWRAAFYGCTFHNSAGSTNTYELIEGDNNRFDVLGAGNIFDDRINNFLNLNGSLRTNPKTETDSDVPFGVFQAVDG